ncbi:MAG: glycosyltransferase, partial [Alphaproteobacteria bacterium]|nr:glycosyltransferase [Alphaproteobacteria bacterium]
MKSLPEISVIIPCFNAEQYIAECLDSVLGQTFNDYEVIIIDDGSTDASLKIIQTYVAKYDVFYAVVQ